MSEPESLSEREFAAELEGDMQRLLHGDEQTAVVVEDAPPVQAPPQERPPAEAPTEEPAPAEEDDEALESPEQESLAWAKRKYGADVSLETLARASYEMEQTISRVGSKVKETETLAAEWYQYAQNLERQMQAQPSGMPMSTAEEQWVESQLLNPLPGALQAKMQGNEALYRAVVNRLAQDDPVMAGQVSAYVETAYAEQARQVAANGTAPQANQEEQIGASVQRLGIDLVKFGQPMMQKVGEMGEYHPYTQAILYGSDSERDLALQAVYDVVRESRVTRRAVRDEEREAQILREGELRRSAAGVLTGGSRPQPQPQAESPFMAAMEAEWRRKGQWQDE